MVVLDPPWENASAKRAWRYPTLPSRNLLAIPMRRLLRPVRCRVCARQVAHLRDACETARGSTTYSAPILLQSIYLPIVYL